MARFNPTILPELAKFIKENFPVVKKRSALWFFTNEFKSNLDFKSPKLIPTQDAHTGRTPTLLKNDSGHGRSTSTRSTKTGDGQLRVSRNRILQMWKNMDPESKRRYFNMAEFDELRFKEQKSLWVSEVCYLMQRHETIDRVKELAPTFEYLQTEFLASLDKMHKSYEEMIQTDSTKMIYKDAIKRAGDYSPGASVHEMISAVPYNHRPILSKPRRPPTAFVLYLNDNFDRLLKLRRDTRTRDSCMKLCSVEWNTKVSDETKIIYEDRYRKLKEDYDKAMIRYRSEVEGSDVDYLQLASRERSAFKKALRKRLRDSAVLPLSTRNAFNFFVIDNKDKTITELSEIWRKLPEEEKMKYIKKYQEDMARYEREKKASEEMRRTINGLVFKSKASLAQTHDT